MAGTAPEKRCDACLLCCEVYDVPELGKRLHALCPNAVRGGGCAIWGAHPATCRAFRCLWLDHPELGPEWRPDRAGFVLRPDPDGVTLWVDEDSSRPGAWRAAPYYPVLKLWSAALGRGQGVVLVQAVDGVWLIAPEEDLFLRDAPKGARLEAGYEASLFGPRPWARVLPEPAGAETLAA